MATAPPKSHAEIAQEASAAGVKNLTAWRLNKSEEQDLAARVTALKAAAEKAGHDFDEADQTMLCKKEVQLRKFGGSREKKGSAASWVCGSCCSAAAKLDSKPWQVKGGHSSIHCQSNSCRRQRHQPGPVSKPC
jgi:hypothetical protein